MYSLVIKEVNFISPVIARLNKLGKARQINLPEKKYFLPFNNSVTNCKNFGLAKI